MTKYKQITAEGNKFSEWIQPKRRGYKMACCDCGLVHDMNFRIFKGRHIQLQARRNNRATGQVRRHKK